MTPEELKQQAHKEFDEQILDLTGDGSRYGCMSRHDEKKFKLFIDSLIDRTVQATEDRFIKKIKSEQFVNTAEAGQFALHADGYNQAIEDIIFLITNKSNTNK